LEERKTLVGFAASSRTLRQTPQILYKLVGNNFKKRILKKNQTDFVNILGIGAFTFLSIIGFSDLLQFVFENILIIAKFNSNLILWFPKVISLVAFSIILVWILKIYKNPSEINIGKNLIKSIVIFFGILLFHFLFSFLNSSFLATKYSSEFNTYYKSINENLELQGYISVIPIFKYIIFGIIILIKRKTIAN
jgi:hypothetical protein